MKKLMSMILLLSMSTLIMAQKEGKVKKSPEERAAKQTQRMVEDLNLSPEQESEVAKFNEMTAIQLHELREAGKVEKERRREEAKAIKAEHENQLQSILSKDQYTKWKSIQEQRRQKHAEKRRERKESRAIPDTGSE